MNNQEKYIIVYTLFMNNKCAIGTINHSLRIDGLLSDILAGRHTTPVLIHLLERERMMTELSVVVSNYSSLRLLVRDLQDAGYVTSKETFKDKRKILVSLTPKGRAVAEHLKKAEEAAMGTISQESEEPRITKGTDEKGTPIYIITPEYRKFSEERRKRLSALIHVNVLDDHITFKETNYNGMGKDRLVTVYVKSNGKGILRLWCELDESFDCWHASEAWSLPDVREMYFDQVKKGNIKGK